jgi:hypothetical protein
MLKSSSLCLHGSNLGTFWLKIEQFWPFEEISIFSNSGRFLDGPLPKLCPLIPTSNQDVRQAKNRKKGDEILIVYCCFSVSQNELKFDLQTVQIWAHSGIK